ncbi:hypothetical protein F4775DRAFT_558918 [Biscogniauxia sp. FL1348]|nr:hypothetical protein F4775DRAFT_558918 [Biscogniauxia sp. FL1348]
MLRHSASQIFGSKHPALTRASANDDRTPPPWMWGGVGSGNSTMRAQQRQQSQEFQSQIPAQDPSPFVPMSSPAIPYRRASPPTMTAEQPEDILMMTMVSAAAHDRSASSLHPVFFTERLHRSPLVLLDTAVTSPVAHGYVYHENQRRADGAIPAML